MPRIGSGWISLVADDEGGSTMTLIRLIYTSRAAVPFDRPALSELARRADAANRGVGITGVLVYASGSFAQVLEGEGDAVRRLYRVIELDPRHRDVQLHWDEPVEFRRFAAWNMGLANLDDAPPAKLDAFRGFLGQLRADGRWSDATGDDPARLLANFARLVAAA